MPFKSEAQRAYMFAHKAELQKQGVNVDEWASATPKDAKLPYHVKQPKSSQKLKAKFRPKV